MRTKKTFGILFGTLLLAATTTGCGHFPSFLPPELNDIEVVASPFKSFVKDDLFEDCADLEIRGYYSDGSTKTLNKSDVELIYINQETGVGYSIEKAIPEAGNYKLRARMDGIVDDYSFSAVASHTYATDIIADNIPDNREICVAPGRSQTITFSVDPLDYTEQIQFAIKDSRIATIKRVDNKTFTINCLEEGESDLYFYALTSPKHTFIDFYLKLISREIYVSSIRTYGPNKVCKNSKARITLGVLPENFTVEITAMHFTGHLKINKIDDTTCEVTGVNFGEAVVTFIAKKNFIEYIRVSHHIEVVHRYATSIKTEEKSVIGLHCCKDIKLTIEPSGFTVDTAFICFNNDIVRIKKVDNVTYRLTGVKLGEIDICFVVADSPNSFIYFIHHVTVDHVYVSNIQVIGPRIIPEGGETTFTLSVSPANFTVSTKCLIGSKGIVTVEKIDELNYKVKGNANGHTTLTFYAPKSDMDYCEKEFDITVIRAPDNVDLSITDLNKNFSNSSPLPTSGNVKMLVIPIWFNDSGQYFGTKIINPITPISQKNNIIVIPSFVVSEEQAKKNVKEDIETAFFGKPDWESVSSFYYKESQGALTITGTVADWYECGKNLSYCDGTRPNTREHTTEVMNAAVDYYFENNKDSRKSYDSNNDGFLDAVTFIYGRPAIGNDNEDNYWAYQRDCNNSNFKDVDSPGINVITWASYDFMYDETAAFDRVGQSFHHANVFGEAVDARCYIHETGHMFGLPDLYGSEADACFTGGYNMQTDDLCSHDPFSLLTLGWAKPFIPTKNCTIGLHDFQKSRRVILLTPKWNKYNSPFDEYLLLEFFSNSDLNNQDGGTLKGIRLWHVNATLYKYSRGEFLNTFPENEAVNFAFNNSIITQPYADDIPEYKYYSLLHLIRRNKDNIITFVSPFGTATGSTIKYSVFNSIDYDETRRLEQDDLFVEGDTFNMKNYASQFVSYYIAKLNDPNAICVDYATLDFGQRLGWEFTIDLLNDASRYAVVSVKKVK